MPIRAENKDLYPKDWPQISLAIRKAAGQRCEKCKAPNGEFISRGWGKDAGTYMLEGGETFDADTGEYLGMSRGSEFNCGKVVRVVLTVAHLDHQPENCAPENLRAWCQRCHNAYDAPMRAKGVADRRRAKLAVSDMFGGGPC
ncbi:MAG TPA: hypothetical protein PK225_03935 [Azonexus sp.]|nr:hypothetical protein [Azonexus sp.]